MLQRFRHIRATRHNVRAHFWQTAANYVQQGLGVAFGIILARLLDPADFGHFAFASATIGLFVLPAGWSLAPQIVSESAGNPLIVSDALRFSTKIVFARIVLVGIGSGWLFWKEGGLMGWLGVGIAVPLALAEFVAVLRASLEAQGQFKGNFFDSILTVVVTMGIAIPAALAGAGVWALVLPGFPLLLCQLWLFCKMTGLGLRPEHPASGKSYFHSGLALWISGTCEQALMRVDKFILGKFSTPDALGNYNRAFNYAPLSARILNSLLTNPTVTALARSPDSAAQKKLLLRTSAILAVGGLANFALWWWFADPIVPLLFGKQWREAIPVFQAMAPMGLVISFAYLPTTVLLVQRRYALLAWGRVFILLVFVAGTLAMAHYLDAVRMAWLFQVALVVQGIFFLLSAMMKNSNPSD